MESDRPFRICFVCTGNICRSPMAEVVMRHLVATAGLEGHVEVCSAATGDWHVGQQADPRARQALADAGYDGDAHRARRFRPGWFRENDLVVALDRGHLGKLRSWAPSPEDAAKVRLMSSFVAVPEQEDVPDPYHHGPEAFREVLRTVELACAGLLDHVSARTDRTVQPVNG